MKSGKKGSTRQMMGITAMENDQVNTAMGDLVYYAVKPTNIGVLPESIIRDRVQALQRLLQGQGELEMMALNAWQSFAHNRDFYRERMEQEAGMRACLYRMDTAAWESREVERLMQDLARQLRSVSGKKQYGYLKKDLKQLVDRVVDELEKQPDVRQFYGEWNALRDQLEGYYKDSPREHLPLSRVKVSTPPPILLAAGY